MRSRWVLFFLFFSYFFIFLYIFLYIYFLLSSLWWGALQVGTSEIVLEMLLYAAPTKQQLSPDELRLKHALASKLMQSADVLASLGAESGSVRHLRAFVVGGPFHTQPPSAPMVAGPLTL